jgi:hypothetical protein
MKKLSLDQMETIQGGRFLGYETSCGAANPGSGVCTCTVYYYVLFIPFVDYYYNETLSCGQTWKGGME